MSKMRKCLGCKGEFKSETDEQLFCSKLCKDEFRYNLIEMVYGLDRDDSLFSVFDVVQECIKKEAQGGEEV